jgi:hypothetical protein
VTYDTANAWIRSCMLAHCNLQLLRSKKTCNCKDTRDLHGGLTSGYSHPDAWSQFLNQTRERCTENLCRSADAEPASAAAAGRAGFLCSSATGRCFLVGFQKLQGLVYSCAPASLHHHQPSGDSFALRLAWMSELHCSLTYYCALLHKTSEQEV